MKITLKTRKNFVKYGVKSYNMLADKQPLKYQLIERKGTPIAILSDRYQLIPNELVIEKADQIAQKLDAKPFVFDDRRWYSRYGDSEHVLASKDFANMSALYVFKHDVDITGNGDNVHMGFQVGNSIDGSRAFSVAVFTFRKVCSNLMIHLHSERMLKVVSRESITANLGFNKTQTYASVAKRHSSSLTIGSIMPTIKEVIKSADNVVQRYRAMQQEILLQQQAEQIVRRIPKNIYKHLGYIHVDENTGKVTLGEKVTQWKAFNDLTEAISHGKTTFDSTLDSMKRVDAIFAMA